MKVIEISGDDQSGKSTIARQLIVIFGVNGGNVLFVYPNDSQAEEDSRQFKSCGVNVDTCGAFRFEHQIRGNRYDHVVLMDVERFPKLKLYKIQALTENRIQHNPYSTLVIVRNEPAKLLFMWVSHSVWYKPWTWGKGYWGRSKCL